MKFNEIDDGKFEELTYDLLAALGFKNISWRRGTGKGGATADQGRDLVADEFRADVDGNVLLDKWFVQCKHYKAGVPPQKIDDALAWAMAERPAVLLIVASNFLSNPAKSFLESYKNNNRPPFKIKVWERKDLERLLSSQPGLVRKYGLEPSDALLHAHPAHANYVLSPTFNTLDFFFEQLDKMSPSVRDETFGWPYHSIIQPRFREPNHDRETLKEMMIDAVDYTSFKQKCHKLKETIAENFLVNGIMTEVLSWTWYCGDPRRTKETVSRSEDAINYFEKLLENETDVDKIESYNGCIAMATETIQSADERQKKTHRDYIQLCETLIPALALESPNIPLPDEA